MPNMTLSIPAELHKKMKEMGEIKWSHVARRAIEERINDLEIMDKIAKKSKLTRKDVQIIGQKIKTGMAKRFNEDSC